MTGSGDNNEKDIRWIVSNFHICDVCCEPMFFADPAYVRFCRQNTAGARVYIVRGICENCGYDSETEIEVFN